MVPILNHSLFININNKTTKVIVEIVTDIELFITILLYLDVIDFTKLFSVCASKMEACVLASELAPKNKLVV